MKIKTLLIISFSVFMLTGCGNFVEDEDGIVKDENDISQKYFFVDYLGDCNGKKPCYITIKGAIEASFFTQFNENMQSIRPNAPADKVIVMQGTYYSKDPRDHVIFAGINRWNTNTSWKLEITSENGPENTIISGRNRGPCIELTDNLDITISGFTITGCYEYQHVLSIVNEDFSLYIQSYYNSNINIINNIFINNLSEDAAIAISPYFSSIQSLNIRISKNIFINNNGALHLSGFPYDPNDTHSAKVLIDNNIIYNNKTGIWIGNFTKARKNISVDVAYNTIVNNQDTGLAVQQTEGLNIKNNIVYGSNIDIREEPIYYNLNGDPLYNDVSNNLVGETSELSSQDNIIGDPLLIDVTSGNFIPLFNSPVIDNASSFLPAIITTDIFENARIADGNNDLNISPDIGAIEVTP